MHLHRCCDGCRVLLTVGLVVGQAHSPESYPLVTNSCPVYLLLQRSTRQALPSPGHLIGAVTLLNLAVLSSGGVEADPGYTIE